MTLYNGVINGPPGDIQGEAVGGAKQPICGGWFTPTLKVFNHRPGSEHHSTMHAAGAVPCIFGGASELCFDQHFEVVDTDGIDIGHIIKKKPADFESAMKEAFTDSDTYSLDFPPEMPAEEKALDSKYSRLSHTHSQV